MLFKSLVGAMLLSFSCLVAALPPFTNEECEELAQNIYAAQSVLNADKAAFDRVTKELEAVPASALDMSEALKAEVLRIAKLLKQGSDPQKVGTAVYQGCRAALKTT